MFICSAELKKIFCFDIGDFIFFLSIFICLFASVSFSDQFLRSTVSHAFDFVAVQYYIWAYISVLTLYYI